MLRNVIMPEPVRIVVPEPIAPIIAVPSGNPEYPWSIAVNLQVSDSGGVGFTVTSMQTVVTAASSGLSASSDQNAFVGVKIPALGQATRQFSWPAYRMDDGKTKEGSFSVKMNFVDDNGFASVSDSTVSIQNLGNPIYLPG